MTIISEKYPNMKINGMSVFEYFKEVLPDDLDNARRWREEAKIDYLFALGDQWHPDDLFALESAGRPAIVLNQIGMRIRAILGTEVNNRLTVQYIPRTTDSDKALGSELLTSAAYWFRDTARGDTVDSAVFRDLVITGMGWSETTLEYKHPLKGEPYMQNLDGFSMVWDRIACKPNLEDARHLCYIAIKPLDYLLAKFPGSTKEDFLNPIIDSDVETAEGDVDSLGTLIEVRFKKHVPYHIFFDPITGVQRDEEEKVYKEYCEAIDYKIESIKYLKERVFRAFLGSNGLLQDVDTPLAPEGHFGWNCATANYHPFMRMYYGLVRELRDPQRIINKYASSATEALSQQGVNNYVVEEDALLDVTDLEHMHEPRAIIRVKSGRMGSIRELPPPQLPAAYMQMVQLGESHLTSISGISPEFTGTRGTVQAGVLEAQRKQSTLNILADIFDDLKQYRRAQGEQILYLIQEHLSDSRLIRIVGSDRSGYVRLTREAVTNVEYDIIIDDAPDSPDEKQRVFENIMKLAPLFKDYIDEPIVGELLKYSNLPASLVEKIISLVHKKTEAQQNQPPNPDQQLDLQHKQLELQKTAAEVAYKHADAAYKQAAAEDKKALALDRYMQPYELDLINSVVQQSANPDNGVL